MVIGDISLEKLRAERDKAYNIALKWLKENKDHEEAKGVNILLSEFYISNESKNELYYKCIELGLIEYKP